MDPIRKRKIRLAVTLAVAVLLATGLVYTSFNASTEAKTPSQLSGAVDPARTFQLTGKVVDGSVIKRGEVLTFAVRDRAGDATLPVRYSGVVPDPFREGREVIVRGRVVRGTFEAEPGSLITKCPSKFTKSRTA